MVFEKNEALSARNTSLHRWLLLFILTLLSALAAFPSHAQSGLQIAAGAHGKRTITAIQIELPVDVDGSLDEPAWQQAQVSLGFVQKDPQEGEASTERTEFRVLYTATTLYVGVICYDAGADGILATERRRDNNLVNDDTITLVLDTFHDHRNAFLFRTNPLGTQYDAMITDEGNDVNENWDEKWDVASQVSPAGWTAEFAIPFKSLRVSEEDGQGWGLDLERVIRRKNEFSYWNSFHRGFDLENISQGGHLEGIEEIDAGLTLRIKPYVLGGFVNERRLNPIPGATDPFRSTFRNASDIGIEVLKYRITPGLTADMTWRTDFAQTEVDDQRVNLDRFPLFFAEKREFFLEGAGIFEFGLSRAEGTTDMKLFHSRRIGLSKGQPVPINAGARITGNLQGFTLGLMSVQTDPLDESENFSVPASNYSVVRVKRNVLARSTVGGFFLNRELGGTADFNRVYGVDANFNFYKYLRVAGLWAKSQQPGNTEQNWVSSGTIRWNSDFLSTGLDYVFIEPNFRDDLGFINQTNIRRVTPTLQLKPRPRSGPIRQIELRTRFDYVTNSDWEFDRRRNHYTIQVHFQSGDSVQVSPHYRFERLSELFRPDVPPGVPEVVVPRGDYGWWYVRYQYSANPARRLSGNISVTPNPGYFGGDLIEWRVQPKLKLTDNLSFELNYRINDITFGQTSFIQHVANFRINYNFNNQWLTGTTIQYNNVDSFAGINFRLNYIFRPGDDLFLVYNEGRRSVFDNEGRQIAGVFGGQKDRSLQLKLTYSFDF